MTKAVVGELQMISALKENRPNDAWDNMVSAHNSAEAAGRAHLCADKLGVDAFLRQIETYEHLLFPEMVFVSPAFSVGSMFSDAAS